MGAMQVHRRGIELAKMDPIANRSMDACSRPGLQVSSKERNKASQAKGRQDPDNHRKLDSLGQKIRNSAAFQIEISDVAAVLASD